MSVKPWGNSRTGFIGASDAGTICGVRKAPSRFRLCLEKRGELEPEPPTEAMLWGNRLEPAICEAFVERTGLAVCQTQLHLTAAERPWMRATLDGVFSGAQEGVVEFKACSSWMARQLPEEDNPMGLPEPWLIQAQHQLHVAGESLAMFAVFADMRLRVYEVERNQEMIDSILTLEDEFWEIINDPSRLPAEFGPDDSQAIKRHFNRASGETIALVGDVVEHYAGEYVRAKSTVKMAAESKEVFEAKLLLAMGNATVAICGPYTLKRSIVNVKERTQTVKAHTQVRFTVSNGDQIDE